MLQVNKKTQSKIHIHIIESQNKKLNNKLDVLFNQEYIRGIKTSFFIPIAPFDNKKRLY